MAEPRRLAVLGSPISHSKSPRLHGAAYSALRLDWVYDKVEMTGERLPHFLDTLGAEWRGLSLTMPVKRDVLPLLDEQDELVRATSVANTVLLEDGKKRGFNTDVYGIAQAFREAGVQQIEAVQVLGGGATAASAVVAAAQLGAARASICVRTPARSVGLLDLGALLGLRVEIEVLGDPLDFRPDAVICTLPNGVGAEYGFAPGLASEATLFETAYEPWPTSLAATWMAESGRVISGLEMLLHQAVMQVRIFVMGDPAISLPDEDRVIEAMRGSLGKTQV